MEVFVLAVIIVTMEGVLVNQKFVQHLNVNTLPVILLLEIAGLVSYPELVTIKMHARETIRVEMVSALVEILSFVPRKISVTLQENVPPEFATTLRLLVLLVTMETLVL